MRCWELKLDYDLQEIEDALSGLGIGINKLAPLRFFKAERCPLPIYFVEIDIKDEYKNKLFHLENINQISVHIEAHISKNFRQCYRQRFNHNSVKCAFILRCVKCTQDHLTRDCPIKCSSAPVRCCTCNGSHLANYRFVLRSKSFGKNY